MESIIKGLIGNLFKNGANITAYEYEEENKEKDWINSYNEFADNLRDGLKEAGFKNEDEFNAYLKEVRREVYEDFQKKENLAS